MNAQPPERTGRAALISVLVPLAGLALVATINRIVDPYRTFSAEPDAIYQPYPALHPNLRLHKRWQVRLQQPDTIVLGTSKAIQGIPMDHPTFAGSNAYNLGVPLASMDEISAQLRHALANGELRRVVLMIDFLSFNVLARTDGHASGYDPARLDQPGQAAPQRLFDRATTLLSLDALRASLRTVFLDPASDHRVLTGHGGRPDADMRGRLVDGGHRSNSLALMRFFTDSVYLPPPRRDFAFQQGEADSFAAFERFLRDAHAADLELSIVIPPSHARLAELIRQAGLQDHLEEWKTRLTVLDASVAEELGRAPFIVLDMSQPSALTTEPFPASGDTTVMRWYYEAIHFNQAAGAKVLSRLDDPSLSEPVAVPLARESIDEQLEASRALLDAFARDYPDAVVELADIIRDVKR